MKKLLLDTNFLLLPFEANLDLFTALEQLISAPHSLSTTKTVKCELEGLALQKNKKAIAAKSALSLLLPKLLIIEDSGHADDSLLLIAKKGRCIVCTNDEELRARLRSEKIPTITLRSHKLALL